MGKDFDRDELLGVPEIARYLKVSDVTVYRWCKQGRLPCLKLGHSWRVRRSALEAFLIGRVKELFSNAAGEPEYVRVRLGVIGKGTVLIPVAFAAPASTVDRPEVVASSSARACESSARTSNTREV